METNDVQRQQLIRATVAHRPGKAADVAMALWLPLESELSAIIGEGGFNSLYARSLYLIHASFPWLAAADSSRFVDFQLADLKTSLDCQSAAEASKASLMLLLTFTDILASLIGESLTNGILRSAWGGTAPATDAADKELPHE
jgi:hypothetical protein